MYEPRDWINGIRWVPFVNASGEEIPARAIMRPTGYSNGSAEGPVLTMAKPNATAQRAYAVNSPEAVPIGAYGQCTFDSPVKILHDSGDGSPAFGEIWEVRSGGWKLRKNASAAQGFVALGTADSVGLFARDLAAGGSGSHYYAVAGGSGSVSSAVFSFDDPTASGSGTEILGWSLSVNPGSHFSIVSNRVRVGSTGYYHIDFSGAMDCGSHDIATWCIALYKNSTNIFGVLSAGIEDFTNYGTTSDGAQTKRTDSTILSLTAGDDLSARAWQWNDSGNSATVAAGISLVSVDHF